MKDAGEARAAGFVGLTSVFSLRLGNVSAMEKSVSRVIRDKLDDPEVRDRLYTAIVEIEESGDPRYVKRAKRHRKWLDDLARRRPVSRSESDS